jgi:hypothetical protein
MVKIHPDAHGTRKKGLQRIGKSWGGWNTKIPGLTVGERGMVAYRRSGGNVPDAVEGRLLPENIGRLEYTVNLLMDWAYENERIWLRAGELGFNPVVPAKWSRVCLGV